MRRPQNKRAEKKTVKLSEEEQVEALIQSCVGTKKTQDKVCEDFLALDSLEVKPFKNHVLEMLKQHYCEKKSGAWIRKES